MSLVLRNRRSLPLVDETDPFERLFAAEYARVTGIAYRVLGDCDEAEDVAQEVFVSFHRSHPPGADYAPAWLHKAAVHMALNSLRGKRRRTHRETDQMVSMQSTFDAHQPLDPQAALDAKEQWRELEVALKRLPAKSVTVLVLRYSGLSYAEAAAAMGVGTGQIGTLLRRAEAALRKEITHASSQSASSQ